MQELSKKTIFKMYFIYFFSMFLFALVRIASNMGVFDFMHSQISSIVFTLIIQVLIMFLVPFILHSMLNIKRGGIKNTIDTINLKKTTSNVIIISIILGILAFFLNIVVSTTFSTFLGFWGYKMPTGTASSETPIFLGYMAFVVDFVCVAVLPAICEEILHRGLLLNDISSIGYKRAIFISSLLFGLIHFNINQFSYAFVIGLLLGLVTIVSKNLWPAIIIHLMNNGISVYISHARTNGWIGGNFYQDLSSFLQSNNVLLTFVASMIFVLLLAFGIIYFVYALFKETTVKNVNKAIQNLYGDIEKASASSPYGPTVLETHSILNEMLLTRSNLNIAPPKSSDPIDVILPINKFTVKTNSLVNTFLIASIVLGGLVTIFTFLWGVLW